jgi:hypothetical protein
MGQIVEVNRPGFLDSIRSLNPVVLEKWIPKPAGARPVRATVAPKPGSGHGNRCKELSRSWDVPSDAAWVGWAWNQGKTWRPWNTSGTV